MKQSKKQKRLQRRKMKRQFVKWLIKNQYFYTWARVQRRREKPTKSIFWRWFINCCFLPVCTDIDTRCQCPCSLYTYNEEQPPSLFLKTDENGAQTEFAKQSFF